MHNVPTRILYTVYTETTQYHLFVYEVKPLKVIIKKN